MKSKYPLAKVLWGDAWNQAGWKTEKWVEENHEPAMVENVGYIVKQDRSGVSLAQGVSDDVSFLGIMFIPRGMIKKITKIKG